MSQQPTRNDRQLYPLFPDSAAAGVLRRNGTISNSRLSLKLPDATLARPHGSPGAGLLRSGRVSGLEIEVIVCVCVHQQAEMEMDLCIPLKTAKAFNLSSFLHLQRNGVKAAAIKVQRLPSFCHTDKTRKRKLDRVRPFCRWFVWLASCQRSIGMSH